MNFVAWRNCAVFIMAFSYILEKAYLKDVLGIISVLCLLVGYIIFGLLEENEKSKRKEKKAKKEIEQA